VGLGEEYAWQLAPGVGHLVLTARRADLLHDLANRLAEAYPKLAVTVIPADLTRADERERLVAEISGRGLVVDLLVNNAGMGDYGEFATAEWPKIEAMLRLNMEALTHLTHLLLPGMIRLGRGAVMNISSLASLLPIPDFAVYAATKAYVTSFSEALRIELRDHGIRVLAVCPGPVHTHFGETARRGHGGADMPAREWFYVPKEQVVWESLEALDQDRPRVYPALKTAAAALVISALPLVLLRLALSRRPRRME
jgi:short-subunit dehydrogenase